MMIEWEQLIDAARDAETRSYAPYSRISVGAALLFRGDRISSGTNVEFAVPTLAICAERNALASAVTKGFQEPRALVLTCNGDEPMVPCGLCLQAISEFAEDLQILSLSLGGARWEGRLRTLLPTPFSLPVHT